MENNTLKLCGCKGIRTCLICEKQKCLAKRIEDLQACFIFAYCASCGNCWQNRLPNSKDSHQLHSYRLDGILLIPDFIGKEEEAEIVRRIDRIPWMPSQSGRKKQDFGPKVNFKKRKVKAAGFRGFPDFAAAIADRMVQEESLSDFQAVELCFLEYTPDRGSAIEPHLDDSWLWGERLVTLNLLSETVLILTPVETTFECNCVESFRNLHGDYSMASRGTFSPSDDLLLTTENCLVDAENSTNRKPLVEVRIPLPERSLLVLSSCARHHWYHEIRRGDITSRRLAMTFRELSNSFLEGGNEEEMGEALLAIARNIVDV